MNTVMNTLPNYPLATSQGGMGAFPRSAYGGAAMAQRSSASFAIQELLGLGASQSQSLPHQLFSSDSAANSLAYGYSQNAGFPCGPTGAASGSASGVPTSIAHGPSPGAEHDLAGVGSMYGPAAAWRTSLVANTHSRFDEQRYSSLVDPLPASEKFCFSQGNFIKIIQA